MNIAVYSGSFNPLHIGHLAIIKHMLEVAGFDMVYLIVSPKNPLKDSISSDSARDRFNAAVSAVHRHFAPKSEVAECVDDMPPPARGCLTEGKTGVFGTTASSASVDIETETKNASSRINVTDNSALGLPRASIRMSCSKGTYVRAFTRDLGETLGSGAHLDSLQRSRSGEFRVENALSVEQAISLLSDAQRSNN